MDSLVKNKFPHIIGITGGIGSGKSSVSKILEEKKFAVYNSDISAKSLVETDQNIKIKIINLFGKEVYTDEGIYNKSFIAKKIFEDEGARLALNQIIHPAVKQDFEEWCKRNSDKKIVFKETALLFELNLDQACLLSILVTAEDNIRIKRIMDRDNKTFREVEAIIKNQMPEKEKRKKTNFVIENNTTKEELLTATEKLLEQIIPIISN